MQRATVRRELLRRVKNRFDELGIEISVPHRILLQRKAD
jgi:small-conductance mechanosensitive channel